MITKGKFSKNKKLQKFIKNILIEKLLKQNEEIEIPKKHKSLSSNVLIKNKAMVKNIPNSFLKNNLYKLNISNNKLEKTEFKNSFKNNLISLIQDKNIGTNTKKSTKIKESSKHTSSSIPKIKPKKNNDEFLLDYVIKNIRDDSNVLNNPRKFYNGFFSTIMKNVNIEKIKQCNE